MKLKSGLFLSNFKRFDKNMKSAVKVGMREAAQFYIRMANNVPPKTPKKFGTLKASAEIGEITVKGNTIIIDFGFMAPYAARWHNTTRTDINWSEPGSGPNYLSSKLVNFGKMGKEIVVKALQKDWKK